MTASHAQIRSRIDQLRLSHRGYQRQLDRLDLSEERRERLEIEVRLLGEEMDTLEKIAQVARVEPDADRVATIMRDRLTALRERMAADPDMAELTPEERDYTSGEVKALLWALGEDRLSLNLGILMEGYSLSDPTRADRVLPGLLTHTITEGESAEARANAAYDVGKMRITQAIPALAAALEDDPWVAEIALDALCAFTGEELRQASLSDSVMQRIEARRQRLS
jgi:predicted HTH domain antitoxin